MLCVIKLSKFDDIDRIAKSRSVIEMEESSRLEAAVHALVILGHVCANSDARRRSRRTRLRRSRT